jgi:hypothetical protein
VTDNDGHDYIIKVGQEADFDEWITAMENAGGLDIGESEIRYDFEVYRVNNSGWTFTDPQGY